MDDKSMICDICGKEFTSTLANLRRHRRYKHNIIENVEHNVKCMEPMCNFSCSKLENLRHHLELAHQISQEVDELQFDDIEEFNKWKTAEECQCVAIWVKRHGKTRQKDPTIYYYCNRSGKKRILAAEQRRRKIKKQGSCKIDFACTSAIVVKIIYGAVKVKYYKTHYGHDNRVDHIPLPADVKGMIASQLIQGVSPTEILNKIRDDADTNLDRLSLITRKDIYNIIREYNLSELYKDKITNKISKIIKSHKVAESAKNMFVIKFDNCWRIISQNENQTVKSKDIEENHLCKLKCTACACCVHCYSCTCLDFVMHNNMCKHIHKVCLSVANEKNRQQTLKVSNEIKAQKELHAIQDKIRKKINSIFIMSDWTNITDQSVLDKINHHLTSALNIIECDKNLHVTETAAIQNNSEVEEQIRSPSAKIIILPPPQLINPLEFRAINSIDTKKDETSRILQKYRPIVPRAEKPLGSSHTEDAQQVHRPIVSRRTTPRKLRENNISLDNDEESLRSVKKFRPIILSKSKKIKTSNCS